MKLYAGDDLHATNNHLAVMNKSGKRIFHRKLPNQPDVILDALKPYKAKLQGIAIESTFNWYWIVDLLMAHGYNVHLANPSAIKQYEGLKYSDDEHDAFWLADMLRLGILPEGYIYPKEERPIRDLLRKRGQLVGMRTALILSLQNIIRRNFGVHCQTNKIKKLRENEVVTFFVGDEDLRLSGSASKDVIDFLTRKIYHIEKAVEGRIKLKKPYEHLLTLPGVGKILALTIMLETGPIKRFGKASNYVSYCRKVPTRWLSNMKTKGKGNKKNGNRYLAWAYSEAAEFARRFDTDSRSFYNRKSSKRNFMVAHQALASKLARAAFYIMRDQVPFDPSKLFRPGRGTIRGVG